MFKLKFRKIASLFYLFIGFFIISCESQIKKKSKSEYMHPVLWENINSLDQKKTELFQFKGYVKEDRSRDSKDPKKDIIVFVPLNKNVKTDLAVGSSLKVSLPLLVNNERIGKVIEVSEQGIKIKIFDVYHDFTGQSVNVSLPVLTNGIFEIPLLALYSPIGGQAFIYIVENDRAKLIPTTIIQLTGANKIVIQTSISKSSLKIITKGLDNLVDGDLIKLGNSHEKL